MHVFSSFNIIFFIFILFFLDFCSNCHITQILLLHFVHIDRLYYAQIYSSFCIITIFSIHFQQYCLQYYLLGFLLTNVNLLNLNIYGRFFTCSIRCPCSDFNIFPFSCLFRCHNPLLGNCCILVIRGAPL